MWYKVSKARYGDIKLRVVNGGGVQDGKSSKSSWWSDILSLESNLLEEFLNPNYCFQVGNGYSTSFWHLNWSEVGILKDFFRLLFSVSL